MYEFITNVNKKRKLLNCHNLTEKLIDKSYKIVENKLDCALLHMNKLNLETNKSNNQT